ncbi:molybdate ABC transporter permease subunit [Chlorogloea sp. CCALA 695]|uniref:molybdate ABC transporter permease subunit n=1 Tax=Chlorogloea sp. CCALA 695 TaxID=2107693 RepID=UPI000D076A4F|nr:molybdate ABC transporter permease subunit [Chlorogloea sp. CCALA 695]PSB35033.1 molybdate ABC transporter permease subunit [Chlorogloea sp. CCALA 695]
MNLDLSPLLISFKTTFIATVITFFLGIAAAQWIFNYRGKGKNLIDGLLTLPLVLPPTVVGFFLLLILGKNGLGQLLQPLGITVIFTWYATVIAAIVVAFPLMYKTALGTFKQIDTNLLAAARTLGASEWRVFWQVTLPLSKSGIIAGTILTFARALGEFGATLMLAGNIPGETQTIPIAIFFAAEGGEIDSALLWIVVIVAISLIATLGLNYWSDLPEIIKTSPHYQERNYLTPQILSFKRSENNLLVDIQKSLPNYTLITSFTADNYPLGLLGASGAGKSMILRCIAGLEKPNKGCIVLNGRVLFDEQKQINLPVRDRHIGFVFQNYALFPHLNVAQNIAFGLQNLSPLERNRRVNELITLMHLQGLQTRHPKNLSGGQQQRVALARALAMQPEVLLLDEPFSALDTHLRSQLEKQLIAIVNNYQGVTLFVTHNLEEVYRVCKNLLVLSEGKTAAYESKESIFEHPRTFTTAQITGCKNFSRAQVISPQKVRAIDWDCTLYVTKAISNPLHIGIRAHQLIFTDTPTVNTFPCWVVQTSETPHRMTIYLKLHNSPTQLNDYHLQAEVFKEKWAVLKDRPFPWLVYLDPVRLFLMES